MHRAGRCGHRWARLQQELRDLRTQLEGFTVDLPAEGVAGVD